MLGKPLVRDKKVAYRMAYLPCHGPHSIRVLDRWRSVNLPMPPENLIQLLRVLSDRAFVCDADGAVQYANPPLVAYLGAKAQEEGERGSVSIALADRERLIGRMSQSIDSHGLADSPILLRLSAGTHEFAELPFCMAAKFQCSFAFVEQSLSSKIASQDNAILGDADRLRELLEIQERERQLIADEIHDGLTQEIIGASMWLESLVSDSQGRSPVAMEAQTIIRDSLSRAVCHARRLIRGLRPMLGGEVSFDIEFNSIVSQFETQSKIQLIYRSCGEIGTLDTLGASNLIRICQQALANVLQHSKGKLAIVTLSRQGDQITLSVEDDGVGFDPENILPNHFGIESIRRRAAVFGGSASIQSTPDKGTTVQVVLPASDLR